MQIFFVRDTLHAAIFHCVSTLCLVGEKKGFYSRQKQMQSRTYTHISHEGRTMQLRKQTLSMVYLTEKIYTQNDS